MKSYLLLLAFIIFVSCGKETLEEEVADKMEECGFTDVFYQISDYYHIDAYEHIVFICDLPTAMVHFNQVASSNDIVISDSPSYDFNSTGLYSTTSDCGNLISHTPSGDVVSIVHQINEDFLLTEFVNCFYIFKKE